MATETTATIIPADESETDGGAVVIELPPVQSDVEIPASRADVLEHEETLATIHADTAIEMAEIAAETERLRIGASNEGQNAWQTETTDLRNQLSALGEAVGAMATVMEDLIAQSERSNQPNSPEPEAVEIVEPMTIPSDATITETQSLGVTESPSESLDESREAPEREKRRRARMI